MRISEGVWPCLNCGRDLREQTVDTSHALMSEPVVRCECDYAYAMRLLESASRRLWLAAFACTCDDGVVIEKKRVTIVEHSPCLPPREPMLR